MSPSHDRRRPPEPIPLSGDGWFPTPAGLRASMALPARSLEVVRRGRHGASGVLGGTDDRLLVVVGPCSVHDPRATLDYAERLFKRARQLEGELVVVMRAYVEKPRTTLGWKGLVNDPFLDGSCDVAEGLAVARRTLLGIVDLGLPVAVEFVDPLVAPYLADLVSWAAIGARSVESPVHRQLASGLSMPVGFKNSSEGDVQVAVDAVVTAAASHVTVGLDDHGRARRMVTGGNPLGHVVLRGSRQSANFGAHDVADARARLERAGQPARVMIDASHGNSQRDFRRQTEVVDELVGRVAAGEPGLAAVMLESFLSEGNQPLHLGQSGGLTYGRSVTDGCIGWESTVEVLDGLARAVERRRAGAVAGDRMGCGVGA